MLENLKEHIKNKGKDEYLILSKSGQSLSSSVEYTGGIEQFAKTLSSDSPGERLQDKKFKVIVEGVPPPDLEKVSRGAPPDYSAKLND